LGVDAVREGPVGSKLGAPLAVREQREQSIKKLDLFLRSDQGGECCTAGQIGGIFNTVQLISEQIGILSVCLGHLLLLTHFVQGV
jgi:hypothetical protein